MTATATRTVTHGVCLRGRAGAIVTVEQGPDDQLVTGIQRLGFALEPMRKRVAELREDPEAVVSLDGEGLGDALYELLGSPKRGKRFVLYARRGIERQDLTRTLLVGVTRRSFRFAPGIEHGEAMKAALLSLTRRALPEEGPGSELCIALSLALDPRLPPMPGVG